MRGHIMVQNGRSPIRTAFAVLVLAQAAHSTEEYLGRLWEALLPPRVVALIFSCNPQCGFLVANVLIVALAFQRDIAGMFTAPVLLGVALRLAYLLRR